MTDFLWFFPRPQHPQYLEPGLHLGWRWGWLRGWMIRPIWKINEWSGGTRVRVGRRFSMNGKIRARGPGSLVLGDDCIVSSRCCADTFAREAEIKIGSRGFINGTHFYCSQQITVGDDAILADARIEEGVKISNNVWIAAAATLRNGVTIGQDSVVGFGSVVTESVPPAKIAVGNPAAVVSDVPE